MRTSWDPNAPDKDKVFTLVRGMSVHPLLRESMKVHYERHGEISIRLVSREKYATEQLTEYLKAYGVVLHDMNKSLQEVVQAIGRMQVKVVLDKHFPRIGVDVPKADSTPPTHSPDNEPWRRNGKRRGSKPR